MKILFTGFIIIFSVLTIFGQATNVKGRIVDDKNEPLVGASITVIGQGTTTISKNDGKFTINVKDINKASLLISFSGFTTQTLPLKGKDNVEIALLPFSSNLNDVVVISALGLTRKAKSVTYSQQSVDPDRLTETRDVNIVNGLAGKVSGLQVTGTGQIGGSSRVVIRGEGSLTGNNQPLWVVDGVPIANNMGETGGNIDLGNGAADLNPDDIESIEILKGPNAAALYGSKAANGAILVTTKKGKPGDKTLGISFNQNVMFNTITEFPLYQNVYGEGGNGHLVTGANLIIAGTGAVNEGSNGSSWGQPMLGQPFNDWSGKPIPGGYTPQPGNVKSIYQTGVTSVTNFSVSKADATSSFRASYTFTKGTDVMQNQNLLSKHNFSLTASRKVGNFLTLDASLMYTYQDTKNRTVKNLDASSPMAAYVYMTRSINASTFSPWKDANGNSLSYGSVNNTENPYWSIFENRNEDAHNRLIGGVSATIQFSKELKFRGRVANDLNYGNTYQFKQLGGLKNPYGSYSNNMQNNQNWNYEGLLMYNQKLNKNLSLTANLGANIATTNQLYRGASISQLLVHDMASISNTNTIPVTGESLVQTNTKSVYGSATLGYKDILYLDLTGRNDWSSTLPIDNCSFFYPSVGGSFIFSDFIKNKAIINYGKLRASWAQVGNSPSAQQLINAYSYGGLFLGNPYLTYTTTLKNANLKPEQTVSKEVGLDLSLFKDRVKLNATFYQSNSTNQIISANSPIETGFLSRVLNAGEIQNKGFELSLNTSIIKSRKFTWNLLTNFSTNRSLVKSLVPGVTSLSLGSTLGATVWAQTGQPYGILTGLGPYKVGDTILVNSNGRDLKETVVLGNFHPDWIGSIGSSFKYGGFDFSFLVSVKKGGSLYSASYGRANFAGNTVASLFGRDAWLFSAMVLNENGNEQQGIGQTVGSTVTRYWDSSRAKGASYQLAYNAKVDPVTGANVVDPKTGRYMVGTRNTVWMNPTTYESDMVLNNCPAITFDATSVKLSEVVIGYTVPPRLLSKYLVKGARMALVGRNLWTIFKNTPQGIDPEASMNTGNGQGLEAGGSFPYAQYGFDLKISF